MSKFKKTIKMSIKSYINVQILINYINVQIYNPTMLKNYISVQKIPI